MPIHLIKLAVGVEDFDHLAALQAARTGHNAARKGGVCPRHVTRQRPKREAELLDGGSLYWVIKGHIRARQRITALEDVVDEEGVSRCAIVLDAQLHATRPKAQRPFQGWRYLDPQNAPPDASAKDGEGLPDDLAAELDDLGLL